MLMSKRPLPGQDRSLPMEFKSIHRRTAMKKQGTTDTKRAAANDRPEANGVIQGSAELVSEAEVPTTSRAQKGVFLETPEWRSGVAKIAAGIPAGKAVRIDRKSTRLNSSH